VPGRVRSRSTFPRAKSRDTIAIEGLEVDCVVGVYPHERSVPQPLRIDLHMALDTARAGAQQRLRMTVDYAQVASQIAFILQSCRFHLLETAAHALTRYLLAPPALGEDRPRVQEVTLRLVKPKALGGNGVPSLEVVRDAGDVKLGHETKPFGTVDVVHETKSEGIYRLNVAPGRSIPLHVHRVMQESEMILGDGLVLNGVRAAPGSVYRWPHGAPHRYDNPTDRWQSILCVDSPPFLPDDEVEVDGEPARVEPEPPFLAPPPEAGPPS
jgi:dihydroneopterin aldolase